MVHSDAKSVSIPGGDLSALIARLEAAEAGSRELDVALAWHRWVEPKMWGSTNAKGEPVWKVERDGKRVPLPAYTTSLDAALALAERVLAEPDIGGRPGRLHDFAQHFNGRWEAKTYRVSDGSSHQSVAATPALALCIAILKAKAQGEGG